MTDIFECCDSCDAVCTPYELASAPRFGQVLCDACAAAYAEANPPPPGPPAPGSPEDMHLHLIGMVDALPWWDDPDDGTPAPQARDALRDILARHDDPVEALE